jgi:hypothetical protein
LRYKQRFIWILACVAFAAALWALDIEITYEHNSRRGVPADFQHHPPRVYNWRA